MTMEMKDRRILIIGGAGFIGHNMALTFKAQGADVHVADGLEVNNLMSLIANSDNVPHPKLSIAVVNERLERLKAAGVPLHVVDARDYHRLSHLIDQLKPQVVVHLAAVSHANRSNKNPYSTFDHSMRTLENALDGSRGIVDHFIFFSSSMVYGNFNGTAVTEDTHCEPLGIYGALKFGGEKMVIAYNQVFGLNYTIIRPSALYGERCISRRVGQIFIENALFGEDIRIDGDGSDMLDFTYIEDLVQGVGKSITSPNARNQVFNITYGDARSIKQMTEILREHFPGIKVNSAERDKLMPERGTLCIDKARKLIGYEPQWPLEKGYPRYIEWYKQLFAENHFQRTKAPERV